MTKKYQLDLYKFIIITAYVLLLAACLSISDSKKQKLTVAIENTYKTNFKIKKKYTGQRKAEYIEKWSLPDKYSSLGWVQYDEKDRIHIADIHINNKLYRKRNQSKWSLIDAEIEKPFKFLHKFKHIEVKEQKMNEGVCDIFTLTTPELGVSRGSWHVDAARVWVLKNQNLIIRIEAYGFMDGSEKMKMDIYNFGKKKPY